MRDFNSSLDWEEQESTDILFERIKIYLLKPIIFGLFSFAVFFSIILFTKLAVYLFSFSGNYNFSIYDISFASLGFAVGFLFKFIIQIKKEAFK